MTVDQQTRFDRWYSEYPRKVARAHAEAAWLSADPSDVQTDQFIDSVQRQAAWRVQQASAGGFVPEWKHPATWLRAKCWLDECRVEIVVRPPRVSIEEQSRIDFLRRHGCNPDGTPLEKQA